MYFNKEKNYLKLYRKIKRYQPIQLKILMVHLSLKMFQLVIEEIIHVLQQVHKEQLVQLL